MKAALLLTALYLTAVPVGFAQTAVPAEQKSEARDQIRTLDQLQKALDDIQGISILTPEQKTFYANQVRAEYEINQKRAEEAYADSLHAALDAWYANNKNWRKIPGDTWDKLTERDKGRIRDGVDPETLARPCPATAAR